MHGNRGLEHWSVSVSRKGEKIAGHAKDPHTFIVAEKNIHRLAWWAGGRAAGINTTI